MAEIEYPAYTARPNLGLFFVLPVFMAIAVATAAWLTGDVAADPRAIVLLMVFTFGGLAIFTRAAQGDRDRTLLFQALVLSWMARVVVMAMKLYLFYVVDPEANDAAAYHLEGQAIAAVLATGDIPELGRALGSDFVELTTGILYLLVGPTLAGGWLLFNFLGLLGMLLHYKAFVTALPEGNRRLFMLLIFFAPTLLVWTNTVGKDALMALFLGMITYGFALFYRRGVRLSVALWLFAGMGGAFLVRPHIAAMAAGAVLVAVVTRALQARGFSLPGRVLVTAVAAAVAVMLVRGSASYVNLTDLSVGGVTEFISQRGEQSFQGRTAFAGMAATTPLGLALAPVTVLFRPFPWEAGNALLLISSVEGLGLLALVLLRPRRILSTLRRAVGDPYLAYAAVFSAMLVVGFSILGNFGILVRQRAQLFPLFFVLLAYSRWRGERPVKAP